MLHLWPLHLHHVGWLYSVTIQWHWCKWLYHGCSPKHWHSLFFLVWCAITLPFRWWLSKPLIVHLWIDASEMLLTSLLNKGQILLLNHLLTISNYWKLDTVVLRELWRLLELIPVIGHNEMLYSLLALFSLTPTYISCIWSLLLLLFNNHLYLFFCLNPHFHPLLFYFLNKRFPLSPLFFSIPLHLLQLKLVLSIYFNILLLLWLHQLLETLLNVFLL